MKKLLAMLCAAMLCACCLGLAACGGSSSSSAAASGSGSASASASASASSASAAVDYTGDWKFAGMTVNMGTGEITMVGDLDAIATAMGGDSSSMAFGLTLKADGTGAFVSGDNTYDIQWVDNGKGVTITDASAASASAESASASASAASESASAASESASASSASAAASEGLGGIGESVDLTYADGVLTLAMEKDGQSVAVSFTKDGKLPGAAEISAENAKPITNEADLVGDWKLAGMNMMGLSIYGDGDALGSMMGSSGVDTSIKFEAGGKGSMSGSEFDYKVGADGASMDSGGVNIPIKSLDGSILLDMSEALGMPMIMVYSK